MVFTNWKLITTMSPPPLSAHKWEDKQNTVVVISRNYAQIKYRPKMHANLHSRWRRAVSVIVQWNNLNEVWHTWISIHPSTSAAPRYSCNSPCVASPVGNSPRGGPGLSGLVHEEAHPSISYHTQPSFKDIEARGPNGLLIQPIPPVDYPVRKKVPPTITVAPHLRQFKWMPSSALSILFQHKQFLEPYPCHVLSHLKHFNEILSISSFFKWP